MDNQQPPNAEPTYGDQLVAISDRLIALHNGTAETGDSFEKISAASKALIVSIRASRSKSEGEVTPNKPA